MTARFSTQQDSDTIIGILFDNARWLESKDIFQWPIEWLRLQEEQIRSDISKGLYYLSFIDENIVTTCRLTTKSDKFWTDDKNAMYLSKLAIDRSHSGKNYGLEMMNHVAAKFPSSVIRLDCVSNNIFLKSFYEHLDYKFIRTVELTDVSLDLYELNRLA